MTLSTLSSSREELLNTFIETTASPENSHTSSFSFDSKHFCGKNLEAKAVNFDVRRHNWDSRQMLLQVTRENITIDAEFVRNLEPALWIDVATEYDAENFCTYLDHLQKTSDLKLSPSFLAFEKAWRRDELNHTTGFVYFYSLLYELKEEEVWQRLRSRPANFAPINHFFKDEFSICMMLAFDELATTRFYVDHLHRYIEFNNPVLLKWIRTVARDEAMHLANILNVLRHEHSHRFSEVPSLLMKLAHWDSGDEQYGATFVLDHEGGQLDPDFIKKNCEIIMKRLGI